jgi:hypothetical protein
MPLALSYRESLFSCLFLSTLLGLALSSTLSPSARAASFSVVLIGSGVWLGWTHGSLLLWVMMLDLGSLWLISLVLRSLPIGYFMMQAFLSLLLWTGVGVGVSVGGILLLKLGGGFLWGWLWSLYGAVLWKDGAWMILVSFFSYLLGWFVVATVLSCGSVGVWSSFFLSSVGVGVSLIGSVSPVLTCVVVSSGLVLSVLSLVGVSLSGSYVLSSVLLVAVVCLPLFRRAFCPSILA